MSTAIPTRRVTRVTRTTTMKDNENANARPSRITTRAKPATTSTTNPTVGGLTKTTAVTRAKTSTATAEENAAVKRKREALLEVTAHANNKVKGGAAGKGKEKVEDGKAVTVVRQPLRTVAGPKHTAKSRSVSSKAEEVPKPVVGVHDDHAMYIDAPAAVVAPRRTITTRASTSAAASRSLRHVSSTRVEEEEPRRAYKKRRTSSEAPEDPPTVDADDHQLDPDSEAVAAKIALDLETVQEETEADPDGDQWEDLDADDGDDPLMVSEYVVEIFEYLKEVEQTTMPNPDYMVLQKELSWKMRGILTDWLVQVHVRFRLLPETLFLCVNLIDRFLSARVVSLAKLQLVGVACMFIAAKFEEIVSPSVSHFLHCADSSYTEAEILQAERYILKTLDYNLSYPNPVHFLRRVSKADDYNVKVRTLGKYLLEIGIVEWRLVACPPSLMAAASIWLARLALGYDQWTPNLAHYSSYPESALIPTANLMLNYILKTLRHEMFYKKYAAKRFLKSSIYMREWALERWQENSTVDLKAELPALKEQILAARAEAERLEQEHGEDGFVEREEVDSKPW